MIKKLIIALSMAALVWMSVISPGPAVAEGNLLDNRPAWVQKVDKTDMTVVHYEDDGLTLWMWVDKPATEKLCDVVIVLKYLPGHLVNKEGLPAIKIVHLFKENPLKDPCKMALEAYVEYREDANNNSASTKQNRMTFYGKRS